VKRAAAVLRHPDLETRLRILEAATRLFAERGFRKVTVREICSEAGANVAAVNYHFGDKLGLYAEILRPVIAAIRATTEEARRAGEGLPPAERLRRYLTIYLRRVLLDAGRKVTHRLISAELADPTPLFDELVEQGMRPRIEYLSAVAAELIGCGLDDPRVAKTVASIQSQTIFYFPHPLSTRLGLTEKLTPEEVDRIGRHIAEFSLGGIAAIAGPERLA
jgi:TetR/AcrR family transcriptional regulator, regulator of cefoperazone and chloramphenicol sensitivity